MFRPNIVVPRNKPPVTRARGGGRGRGRGRGRVVTPSFTVDQDSAQSHSRNQSDSHQDGTEDLDTRHILQAILERLPPLQNRGN